LREEGKGKVRDKAGAEEWGGTKWPEKAQVPAPQDIVSVPGVMRKWSIRPECPAIQSSVQSVEPG
jgi:hypothetical protein